ncbi:hypothetical protein AGMMS49579_18340 [Spirochaetia bacterium]|nr:hypothetical protein AGMMS49579_18340 [Spirochaetia bacterium]
MKKLIAVSILLSVISVSAFAQFSATFTGRFAPDLLQVVLPTGDFADNTKANYKGGGTFNFFNTSNQWGTAEWRLNMTIKDPEKMYETYYQLKLDSIFGSLMAGNAASVTLDNIWAGVSTGDWYAWGRVGKLWAYLGNTTPNRGKTNGGRFTGGFSDWGGSSSSVNRSAYNNWASGSLNVGKNDNFGVQVNTSMTDVTLSAWDINNLSKGPENRSLAYAWIQADLSPIFIDFAGGTNLATSFGALDKTFTQGQGSVRISGDKIADAVSFDAVYKIAGGDPNTDPNDQADNSQNDGPQPDGRGVWSNAFGVYGHITAIKDFGISFGYSGVFKLQEDTEVNNDTVTFAHPFYSGIDLRLYFTGVENLGISFNNNVSFASVKGDGGRDKVVYGFDGATPLNDDDFSQAYFAWYSGLGVSYKFTDTLTGYVNLIEKLYKLDNTNATGKDSSFLWNGDRVALSVAYTANSHVILEGGVALDIVSTTTTPVVGDASTKGNIAFSIPLRVRWSF